jgi:hypothetical protein
VTYSKRLYSINIIAAISSQGLVAFTVNRGRTISSTFMLFLAKLISQLDSKDSTWRQTTIDIIDNAPYLRSRASQEFLRQAGVPAMFLGP